ncbi:hypothetical protein HBI56_095000 [Parastagonospora nodorum]|nr:hypothetical protein HBH53_142030 [Parastagonospora nodorum]KAH3989923.1 hypothetical protein HBH52_018340 [Parastagonospora nodorum]KAH3998139.1 hypothetical protein HBI10_131220 [Parastagonospora nodorum]KAH4030062.1 hypothetical protein HBI13_036380 [Parastagonospora nodorum]KAH4076480.1 hypothetical protein HBH50_006310 [Parastagonospora nodorum]
MHDNRPPRGPRQTGRSSSYNQPMDSIASPSRQQHSEESWVEIGSGPSSASLSSATDEIITTGLTVQHDSNLHRRPRRARGGGQFSIGTGHRVSNAGGNSSQEEYEESESESDRVMTSSNEGLGPSPLRHEVNRASRSPLSVASSETMSEREEDDDDDDENATAVNYPRSRRQFEPRPNAFSHPSNQQPIRSQSGTVYPPRRGPARPSASVRQQSYPQHTPIGAAPDHDEALRASLSTLLSAAAAVRGLPKPGQPRTQQHGSSRIDPTTLRLVPESVALGDVLEESSVAPSSPSSSPSEKSKRKEMRSSSKDRRNVKKARRTGPVIEEISPTLLTWVVSAGVVVLVSALSFSAGYVVGKESGHAEAMNQMGAAGAEAGSCAREAASGVKGTGLGLRKLRWTGGAGIRA